MVTFRIKNRSDLLHKNYNDMNKLSYVFYLVLVAFFASCGEGKLEGKILTDESGYKYKLRHAKNDWYEVQPITVHLKDTVSCN